MLHKRNITTVLQVLSALNLVEKAKELGFEG